MGPWVRIPPLPPEPPARVAFFVVGFEGPGVNDAPVERQSRPRPSPQARIESHRFRQTPPARVAFFVVGFEGPGVNDAPVERQSRPRPSREARIESSYAPLQKHADPDTRSRKITEQTCESRCPETASAHRYGTSARHPPLR